MAERKDDTVGMRPPQAALYVPASESKLAKLRLSGEGPVFYKIGRSVVYMREDLDAWRSGCRRTSTSDPGPLKRTKPPNSDSDQTEARKLPRPDESDQDSRGTGKAARGASCSDEE